MLAYFPGVPIFFIVSGFLVSRSLERSSSLASFYRKRALRIYPALLVCLVVSIGIAAVFTTLPWASPQFFAWLAAQVTIVQFYNPDFLRGFGLGVLNGSLWTIPVELQFYIVLPLIYLAGRRLGEWIFWGLAIVALAGHTAFLTLAYGSGTLAAKLIQVSVLPWLGLFMIGVLAQQHWHRIAWLFYGRLWLWLAIYAAVAATLTPLLPNLVTGNRINALSGIALAGVVLAAAHSRPGLSQSLLGGNDISYGTYLYHGPFINVLVELQKQGQVLIDGTWGVALVVCATLATATASWLLVEKPALALKRRKGSLSAAPRPELERG